MPFGRTRHIPEEDLSALLDGRLRGDAKARAAEHCRACGECRAALDDLRVLRSSLRELPRAQAPRSFAVQAVDVRRQRGEGRPSLLVRAMPMLSGATVVALVAFMALVGVDLSGGGGLNRSSDDFSSAASREGADILSAPGATLAVDQNSTQYQSASPAPPARESDSRNTADGAIETPVPLSAGPAAGSGDNGSEIGLRIAEGVAAALALASGGLVLAAWRRTR